MKNMRSSLNMDNISKTQKWKNIFFSFSISHFIFSFPIPALSNILRSNKLMINYMPWGIQCCESIF